MDKMLEEFFSRNFGAKGMTNPFNNDAFTNYISEQIKNALPNNMNWLQGNGEMQNNPSDLTFQQQPGDHTFSSSNNQSKEMNYHVFEMHEFLIVRIQFSNTDPYTRRKILLNSYELLLIEEGREKPSLSISLPKQVSPKKTKLTMLDGILEIQMLKKSPEDYSEFEII
ncbi:hypothetical protein [Lederbergia citri]|uniref:Uncharacterized protein n=1 Tax=Lederbergia citri TaxID=2833580 RepID=A0A942TC40_9BACI|nr:hypothetical protein [Lederbergia citri]MBS4193737.1 hypothetical protein [Lederbergia citri]